MVALQIISKVLATKSVSIIEDNMLTKDHFVEYPEEYEFIMEHYHTYHNVPDEATFLDKFPNMELVEVTESDKYLVDTIQEEYLYYRFVPIIQKSAELLKVDANQAAEYFLHSTKNLTPHYGITGTDIIAQAHARFEQYLERKNHQNTWFFTTGFPELDDAMHGLQRGEELVVILARTNEGKSWILEKICSHIWQIGYNVGYLSPEMGEISVGYRFDTLTGNYSNKDLMWGKDDIDEDTYKDYIDDLATKKNNFIVSTPRDFGGRVTVSSIKNWIQQFNLDMIGIDGITYLTDERAERQDSRAQQLTHISEDLMSLSVELSIPIVVVAQANRTAAYLPEDEESTPEIDSVQYSDGISQNASKLLSLRQLKKSNTLRMEIKKQRFGPVNKRIDYKWNINTGEFILQADETLSRDNDVENKLDSIKKRFNRNKDEKENAF